MEHGDEPRPRAPVLSRWSGRRHGRTVTGHTRHPSVPRLHLTFPLTNWSLLSPVGPTPRDTPGMGGRTTRTSSLDPKSWHGVVIRLVTDRNGFGTVVGGTSRGASYRTLRPSPWRTGSSSTSPLRPLDLLQVSYFHLGPETGRVFVGRPTRLSLTSWSWVETPDVRGGEK